MPAQIEFLSIQEEFFFVQYGRVIERFNLADILDGKVDTG